MGLSLDFTIASLCVFCALILGAITRDHGIHFIQEKFYGLVIGLTIGGVLYLFGVMEIVTGASQHLPILIIPYLLEKTFDMPKAFLFNRLGSIFLLSVVGGILSVLLASISIYSLSPLLGFSISTSTAAQLVIIFTLPGGPLGIEKEISQSMFLHLSLSSICFMYPLFNALTNGAISFVREWSLGLIFGIAFGTIGSFLLRLTFYSKLWSIFEVSSCLLISIVAYQVSFELGGSPEVALVLCSIILTKYAFIAEISQLARTTMLSSFAGICEILGQLWIGASIWGQPYSLSFLFVIPIVISISCICNLFCMSLGYACKLKSIKLKDCLCASVAGFRSLPTICLISLLPTEHLGSVVICCIVLNFFGILTSWFLGDSKDESSYLISSNPCSKLKVIIQGLEENYILPIFIKESNENVILSPKFNENSQRFDTGIQVRQEPKDETSRELQALNLNLNLTEIELPGGLQLK